MTKPRALVDPLRASDRLASGFFASAPTPGPRITRHALFKLDELKSLYGDPVATKILEEVEASQKKSPRSPAWEEELLGKVQARTSLLDLPEVTGLRQLLEHRHYSAHPVMTSGYTLYAPTRESARAHIRTALEAVLTKPSIMVRKIHDSLLEDLEARSALFPDDEELRRFLEAKYFSKMLPPVQDATFTSLWRVAFKSRDKRAEDSRPIIFRALRLLYIRAPDRFRDLISKSRDYFSEVEAKGTSGKFVVRLMSEDSRLYSALNDAGKALISGYISANPSKRLVAWFLEKDLATHLKRLTEEQESDDLTVKRNDFARLVEQTRDEGLLSRALAIGIRAYGASQNYNNADENFEHLIEPYLDDFDADLCKLCLAEIEENAQVYGRGRARRDHPNVGSRNLWTTS